jgi:hypothetical protein
MTEKSYTDTRDLRIGQTDSGGTIKSLLKIPSLYFIEKRDAGIKPA